MSIQYLVPEFRTRLKANLADYKEAGRITDVPWVLLAALHYRETKFGPSPGAASCMQFAPVRTGTGLAEKYSASAGKNLRDFSSNRLSALICAGYLIKEKMGNGGITASSPRSTMLTAAYRYNGTGYGDIKKSPYVFNDPKGGNQMYFSEYITDAAGNRRNVQGKDDAAGVAVVIPEILEALNVDDAVPVVRGKVYYPLADFGTINFGPPGGFLDPGYPALRMKTDGVPYEHPGVDLNGPGGGDTDLGFPIYAVTDGIVKDSGFFVPLWGNMIQITHPQYGVASVYAHLQERFVREGDTVEGGQLIGTMGKGAVNKFGKYQFFSHLHLEIRTNLTLEVQHWPGAGQHAKDEIHANYRSPVEWLRQHDAQDVKVQTADLHPDLIRIRDGMSKYATEQMPGYRLQTTRTYWNPLNAQQAAQIPGGAYGAGDPGSRRNPHTVRPALAFDFALLRNGSGVSQNDPAYAKIGAEGERLGGLWGPNVPGGVLGEQGNLRNHMDLKNGPAAMTAVMKKVRAGLIPNGSVDTYTAGKDSGEASPDSTQGAPCKGSIAPLPKGA